jgi:hypothetical protein
MKRTIITLLLLLSFSQLFAQFKSDTIEIKKPNGAIFRQNGKNLTPWQLLNIMQPNAEAFKEMKIAKSNNDVGSVFGFAGGFMVGYTLGTALGGGKPNWAFAGIGAGLIGIAIPFSSGYSKHARNAVRIYNNGKLTAMNRVDFKMELTYNGLGVKMNF